MSKEPHYRFVAYWDEDTHYFLRYYITVTVMKTSTPGAPGLAGILINLPIYIQFWLHTPNSCRGVSFARLCIYNLNLESSARLFFCFAKIECTERTDEVLLRQCALKYNIYI